MAGIDLTEVKFMGTEGEKVGRSALAVGVSVAGDDSTIHYIGKDLEGLDLTIETEEKIFQNIFDETLDSSKIKSIKMTIAPFAIRAAAAVSTGLAKIQGEILAAVLSKKLDKLKFATYIVLRSGTDGNFLALKYAESTWKPSKIGGTGADGVLDMPIDVVFAGKESTGTADGMPPDDLTAEFTEDIV